MILQDFTEASYASEGKDPGESIYYVDMCHKTLEEARAYVAEGKRRYPRREWRITELVKTIKETVIQ